jgi:AcrR family transcriptional regulator
MLQNRGRNKEKEIYQVAAHLFNKHGFGSTSIRQICSTIGIRESSLYHYIRNKEDLLFNICESSMLQSLKGVEPIRMSNAPSVAKLRKLIETHIVTIAQNANEHSTMLKELRSLGPKNQRKIIKLRDQYEGICRQIIQECLTAKVPQKAKIVSLALLGMMNWLIHWYSPEGNMKSEEIAQVFEDLFIGGIYQRSYPRDKRKRI